MSNGTKNEKKMDWNLSALSQMRITKMDMLIWARATLPERPIEDESYVPHD